MCAVLAENTEKGRALRSVPEAMRDWGLKWEPATNAEMQ
jgi:DNA-binding HxlR family transcriptional regulator